MSFLDKLLAEGLTAFGKVQFQIRPPAVRAADCRIALAKVKSGMVICRKFNSYLDGKFIPGEYSHSGIIESEQFCIHSVAEGVERIDILDFIKDSDGFALLEPKYNCYNEIEAVQYARHQLGKPYDFKFQAEIGEVTAFFCHELTARCLEAGGIKIIPMLKGIGPIVHEVYLAEQFINDPRLHVVYATAT